MINESFVIWTENDSWRIWESCCWKEEGFVSIEKGWWGEEGGDSWQRFLSMHLVEKKETDELVCVDYSSIFSGHLY